MKKAFTLVELLVVVTVISILMTMVMRFGNLSSASQARNRTIDRLQRLENALSGYYAAYGTYPPVKEHGTRNIYRKVNELGVQSGDTSDRNEDLWGWINDKGEVTNESAEQTAWDQVNAACKAQPVVCNYPYSSDDATQKSVIKVSDELKEFVKKMKGYSQFEKGFDAGYPNRFNDDLRQQSSWTSVQLFRFGLMSYLLPRYLFMLPGMSDDGETYLEFAQWTDNNNAVYNPLTGQKYEWKDIRKDVKNAKKKKNWTPPASVASIQSQAVCGRWMPNFENALSCTQEWKFYGVDVKSYAAEDEASTLLLDGTNVDLELFAPGGYEAGSGAGQYVLDGITVLDGWSTEFYYYSPAPYQSYVLWSAGPNKRTFPPWISIDSLSDEAKPCARYWSGDDIVNMKR